MWGSNQISPFIFLYLCPAPAPAAAGDVRKQFISPVSCVRSLVGGGLMTRPVVMRNLAALSSVPNITISDDKFMTRPWKPEYAARWPDLFLQQVPGIMQWQHRLCSQAVCIYYTTHFCKTSNQVHGQLRPLGRLVLLLTISLFASSFGFGQL